MAYSITEEEREVISELKSDLIQLQKELKSIALTIVSVIATTLIKYCSNLNDYRLANIQQKGLGEVLYERALRFFGLTEQQKEAKKEKKIARRKNKRSSTTIATPITIKRVIRLIILPGYLFVCSIIWFRRKKMKKFVNSHKTS
jgi:hypothetical protein